MGIEAATIPSAWMGITNTMSAAPHLALMQEVRRRGVDPRATAVVSQIWQEMQRTALARCQEIDRLDAEATAAIKARRQEAAILRQRFPGMPARVAA